MGKPPPRSRATPHTFRSSLTVRAPFEFGLAVTGHGWFDLEPHTWHREDEVLSTVLPTRTGPADARIAASKTGISIRVASRRPLDRIARAACRETIRRILRLDEDLADFWQKCSALPRLGWVAARGGGRIMRSATVFEDLMKLLCTTNCSWAATSLMVRRLAEQLGEAAPSGRRAFPTAAACAGAGERFFREEVRAGYRASSCTRLAVGFAEGELNDGHFDDPTLPTEEVRARILALPGFGPYAAGQALRLLGRYDDLALDSWCRARLAKLARRKTPPSDAAVEKRYRRFGEHKGLALWMDLTAEWHGE